MSLKRTKKLQLLYICNQVSLVSKLYCDNQARLLLSFKFKVFHCPAVVLLLSKVNKGYVLVMHLQKRTEFSGGLACAIIKN